MAARSIFPLPNFTLRKSNRLELLFDSRHQRQKQNDNFTLQAWAPSLPSSPINVGYLEREFSGHGAAFEAIGDECVIKMGLEQGTTANLVLPSALITSYKPKMWHGGKVELLHTLVSEDQNGEAVIHGGVSIDLKCECDGGFAWSPSTWALLDVRGDPDKFIQVELISVAPHCKAEAKCVVTLQEDQLSSELMITNPTASYIQLAGSIMSHLKVSTPDATYAVGLQGSNYCSKQPISSKFRIVPPESRKEKSFSAFFRSWAHKGLDGLFSGWHQKNQEEEREEEDKEKEESNDYAQMNNEISRIYTFTPMEFTMIDRGKRNSVVIQRNGFEEIYIFSPGSDHDWYGKYAFVCVGPAALMKPIVLGPGGAWKGAQHLHNPNL